MNLYSTMNDYDYYPIFLRIIVYINSLLSKGKKVNILAKFKLANIYINYQTRAGVSINNSLDSFELQHLANIFNFDDKVSLLKDIICSRNCSVFVRFP